MNNPQPSKKQTKNFLLCFSCCWLSERHGNFRDKHGCYQLKLSENKGKSKTGPLFVACWHLLIFCHQKIDKPINSPIINIIQIDGPASINVHARVCVCVYLYVCVCVCVCVHNCATYNFTDNMLWLARLQLFLNVFRHWNKNDKYFISQNHHTRELISDRNT